MMDTCEVSRTLPGTAVGLEDSVALHSPLRPLEAEFHVSSPELWVLAAETLCTLNIFMKLFES